jgi:hypothetical protein
MKVLRKPGNISKIKSKHLCRVNGREMIKRVFLPFLNRLHFRRRRECSIIGNYTLVITMMLGTNKKKPEKYFFMRSFIIITPHLILLG